MISFNRGPINWVLCAAGEGLRFKKHGVQTPKPLLRLYGLSFLERAILGLDFIKGDRLIIISQLKHKLKENLSTRLSVLYPHVELKWIEIEGLTSGQLESFYKSKESLNEDWPTAIYNSDTYFKSLEFDFMLRNSDCDSIVPCGEMATEAWSFFKTDDHGNVCEVKEKKKISDNASVGMYYFKNTKLLLENTQILLKEKIVGELFVSRVFDLMLEQKKLIKLANVDTFLPFGTFEQLEESWGITKEQFLEKYES